jgi:hypothetical protein
MNEATATVPHARTEIKFTAADEARFWAKVNKDGPTMPHMESPCWVWTAFKNQGKYGMVGVGGRKVRLAHRVSWILSNGPIPHDGSAHGICVLHRCDNPSCVNPSHLFLGTNADNVRDKTSKGRNNAPQGDRHGSRTKPERLSRGNSHYSRLHPEKLARGNFHGSHLHPERLAFGVKHGLAKLTDAKVIDIRTRYAAGGISQKELGVLFGVSSGLISHIVNRRIWRHIP